MRPLEEEMRRAVRILLWGMGGVLAVVLVLVAYEAAIFAASSEKSAREQAKQAFIAECGRRGFVGEEFRGPQRIKSAKTTYGIAMAQGQLVSKPLSRADRRRRNPPMRNGGLRFANPPYALPKYATASISTNTSGFASARTSTSVDAGKSPVKNSRRARQTSVFFVMSTT